MFLAVLTLSFAITGTGPIAPPDPPGDGLFSWLYPNQPLPPVGLYELLAPLLGMDPEDVDWQNINSDPKFEETEIETAHDWLDAAIDNATALIERLDTMLADQPDFEGGDSGLTYNGEAQSMTEAAEEIGAEVSTVFNYVRAFASLDEGFAGGAIGFGLFLGGWYFMLAIVRTVMGLITALMRFVDLFLKTVDAVLQAIDALPGT